MKSKIEVVEEWFRRVWTEEDTEAIYELFTPEDAEGNAKGLQKEAALGPKEFVGFQQALLALLKNVHVSVDSYIEQGDIISSECTFSGIPRQGDSEEPVSMKGSAVVKIIDGKMVTASNYFDFIELFEGLGLLPQNTLATCLAGKKVCP